MSTATLELETCLRERFGLDQFRPGQREVIETVLAGRDCLCVMPTGGGKSLCYQLPALMQGGVTLVVSPLIALMKDQVDGLVERGIRATLINSTIDTATQNARIEATERGEFDLVYVAPERFRSKRFSDMITRTRVALLAIDEAHCISEWGHDFRPDYTRLGVARKRLGNPPTIALTATATDHVRRDICEQLELADPRVFITGFDRPNLRYEVRNTSSDLAKQQALREVLGAIPGAGIIYCSSRKRCEEVAEFLRDSLKRKSLIYHAGLQGDDRRRAQDEFMNGKNLVVVATNAFGMGVDKPDIRFVIHFNMPGTVEAYYQEAGRAGRDGAESLCMLLYATGDRYIQEFFIESEYPSRDVVATIYDFLAHQDFDPIELTQAEIKDRLRLEVSEMGVGASLKLLEGAGALERLRPRENMAIIRIDSDVSLVGLLPTNATTQRRVLSALEQLVASSRGDDTYFSPHFLASRLSLDPTQLTRAIHELRDKLPVEYVPPFRGNAVRMLDRTRKIGSLGIDFDKIDKLRAREYEKLEHVIGYARSRECRRRSILTYFGDTSPVACGHCDNCNSKPVPAAARVEPSERTTEIVRKILSGVARAAMQGRSGFGKRIVAAMLVGKNTKQIRTWRFERLSTFGLLADFTEDEVVQIIENLITAGWVQQEEFERFRPVISISPQGRDVMLGERPAECTWHVSRELAAKLRQGPADEPTGSPRTKRTREPKSAIDVADLAALEPPKPVDRELLKKLKDARDRWAAETQLPHYMVLANPVLQAIASEQPRSRAALLAIKGIGPAKVERYGDRLLEILGVPRSNDRGGATASPKREVQRPAPESHRLTRESRQESRSRPPATPRDSDPFVPRGATPDTGERLAREDSAHGPPSHYWTWRLLERGFTQSECALIRGLDEQTIVEHALAAARDGHAVPLDGFLPEDLIDVLAKTIDPTPQDRAASIDELPDEITPEIVELFRLTRRSRDSSTTAPKAVELDELF